jgi:hypothetical protein
VSVLLYFNLILSEKESLDLGIGQKHIGDSLNDRIDVPTAIADHFAFLNLVFKGNVMN